MFGCIKGRHVEAQQAAVRIGKQGAGGRCEILQACTYADHQIGLLRQRIGSAAAGNTDGAELRRVIPGQGALARLGFRHRQASAFH